MSEMSFVIVRLSDGIVVTSGSAGSELQLETQREYCPEGHEVIVGVDVPAGWQLVGDEFVPPAPPPVTVAMVKEEQGRRMSYSDWNFARANDPTDGRPVPDSVLAERQAIRDAAHRIEAMNPIPTDFKDPKYWS